MDASVPGQQAQSEAQPQSQHQPAAPISSAAASAMINVSDLYRNDPLLRIQRHGLPVNPIVNIIIIIAGVLVLSAGVLFGLAALAGASFDLGKHFGDTIRALLQVVIFPVMAAIYLFLPDALANLFNSLEKNGVIGQHKRADPSIPALSYDYGKNFLPSYIDWVGSIWWTVGALAFIVLVILFRLLLVQPQATINGHPLPLWFHITLLVIYAPMIYCVLFSLIRLIVTLVYTNILFSEFTINVNPLHPDGYAGLGILGTMLGISTGLMVATGIAALVMNSSFLLGNSNPVSQVEAILLGVGYVALAPTLIIGWLILPHNVMQSARDEALRPLADQFEQANFDTAPKAGEDARAIEEGTARIKALKERYDFLQNSYPVWPADIDNVRRYVAAISLTALIPVVQPLLNNLFSYLQHTLGI